MAEFVQVEVVKSEPPGVAGSVFIRREAVIVVEQNNATESLLRLQTGLVLVVKGGAKEFADNAPAADAKPARSR